MTARRWGMMGAALIVAHHLYASPEAWGTEPSSADSVSAEADRPPPSGRDTPWTPPEVIERRLENGIRILMVERRDLPIVHIGFVIKRGAADGPPGVANCTMAFIHQQAHNRFLPGAAMRFWSNYDALGILAVGITRGGGSSNLPTPTFVGIRDLLSTTAITTEAFQQVRPQCVAPASEGSVNANALLLRLEHQALYPPDHPYHQLLEADEIAAGGIGPEAVVRFLQAQVQPDQLVVVAVGDLARESLWDSIRLAFGDWKGHAAPRKPLPEPLAPTMGGDAVTLLDQPGLSETQIRLATRGVPWQSPDYQPLVLLNRILGGSFTSRLNLNLRERNTYSYQAGSEFEIWRGEGPLEARGAVAAEHTVDAIGQIFLEIDRLRSAEITLEELTRVKRAAIRRLPLMALDLTSMLDAVATLGVYDRPANDYVALPARIEAVTASDILRVARKYLARERLRWFLVADAAVVAKPLEALHLGSLQVRRLGDRASR